MGGRELIVLMSVLMSLTALAIDMMLPAFGDIRATFGLPQGSSAVAPVVTVFLLGLGVGQPIWGPLSDALGRKRILWLGLAIYAGAAAGAALAGSLALLLTWRFVGGLGAGAVRVVAQGTIRDRSRGEQMAKLLSYIMAIFILVPVVAPTLGTAILAFASWRAIFAALVLGALLAAAWSVRLPESLPPERRIGLSLRRLGGAAVAVLTSRFAMGLTIAQTASFGFFASYLATSELLIGDVFGLADWFPLIFGATALVLGTGMVTNPRLLDRFGLRRLIRMVMTAYPASMVLLAGIALATGGRPPFWLFVIGLVPVLLAHSLVMPNLNSAAMMPMGRIAGTAVAVIGSISTLGGALIGAAIDRAYDGTITPFALAGVLVAVVAYACYRWSDAAWARSVDVELGPSAVAARATSS
jgi:DHA1 family bicyclomycin/chloramphenicol resistance-like MFS transporter